MQTQQISIAVCGVYEEGRGNLVKRTDIVWNEDL